jgi:hypothetical protein
MAGLDPAISLRKATCPPYRPRRHLEGCGGRVQPPADRQKWCAGVEAEAVTTSASYFRRVYIREMAQIADIERALARLSRSLASDASEEACLRRWSEFIRIRDDNRCVDCHATNGLSAHHICRKSFIRGAKFLTGNGITLCTNCHHELHAGFNQRPDLTQPIDAQGGEKLQLMERLYSILTDDAVDRGLTPDDFYFLSDELLCTFKLMQGYSVETYFPGSRIEQAYLILAECEMNTRRAILEAEGMPLPDRPLLPGGLYLVLPEQDGEPRRGLVIQTYVPRTTG